MPLNLGSGSPAIQAPEKKNYGQHSSIVHSQRNEYGELDLQRIEDLHNPPQDDLSNFLKSAIARIPPLNKFNPQHATYYGEELAVELLEKLKNVVEDVVNHGIAYTDSDIERAKLETPELKTYYIWNSFELLDQLNKFLSPNETASVSVELMSNQNYFYHSVLMLEKKLIWMQIEVELKQGRSSKHK
jgi:hypothetical protein